MRLSRKQAYILAIVIHIALLPWFAHDWDVYVWREVARDFYYRGLTPYEVIITNDSRMYPMGFPYECQWYAYPPILFILLIIFYLPCFILSKFGLNSLVIENICVKLPMVIGNFVLALAVRRILIILTKDEKKAYMGEYSVLFNPFFIWLAAGWGMFDTFVFGVLLWAIIFLYERKFLKGSLLLVISALFKQTVWFTIPFIIIYLMRKFGLKSTLKTIFYSVAFGLIIIAPFILQSPEGFLYAILKMHAKRAPAGYNIYFLVTGLMMFLMFNLGMNPLPIINALTSIFSVISLLILGVLLLRLIAATLEEREFTLFVLLDYLLYVFLFFLAFSKVTNEQYFVYPITISLIESIANWNQFSKFWQEVSSRMLLCTLIGGLRILTFLPPYTVKFLQLNPYSLLYYTYIIGEYSIIIEISSIIGAIIVLPVIIDIYLMAFEKIRYLSLAPYILAEYFAKIKYFGKVANVIFARLSRVKLSHFLSLMVTFVFLLSVPNIITANTVANSTYTHTKSYIVGIYYNWIFNPAHDSSQQEGSWINAKFTPIEGYYEVDRPKLLSDFSKISKLGIDFVVVEYYQALGIRFSYMLSVASKYNLTILPCINLSMILLDAPFVAEVKLYNGTTLRGYYALKSAVLLCFIDEINRLLHLTGDINLKIKNKPALIIVNARKTRPGYSEEEKLFLANALIEMIQKRYGFSNETEALRYLSRRLNITISSVGDLLKYYPKNDTEFLSNDLMAMYWRQAFRYAWSKFWREIANRTNTPYLILGDILDDNPWFNQSLAYSAFNSTVYLPMYSVEDFKNYAVNYSSTFITVFPFKPRWWETTTWETAYVYDELWQIAYEYTIAHNESKLILIYAWNDYINGQVIEPTQEFKYMLLNRTYEWITKIKEAL